MRWIYGWVQQNQRSSYRSEVWNSFGRCMERASENICRIDKARAKTREILRGGKWEEVNAFF